MGWIDKFKRLFTREKSEEAMEMWEELSTPQQRSLLDDPDLKIDYDYAVELNHKERQEYLNDIWNKRHRARAAQYALDQEQEQEDNEDD